MLMIWKISLSFFPVFRIVPYVITTALTVIALFVIDRKLLKEIDYMLLLTFVCFFIVSENLGRIETIRLFLQKLLQQNTLLTAVGTSQVISNVPACLLLSPFTGDASALMLGVNLGGLGTLVASLASLISFRLYGTADGAKKGLFMGVFTVLNVLFLAAMLTLARMLGAV